MTNKKRVQEYFDLGTEPVLNQLNDVKQFINETEKTMTEDELEFYTTYRDGLSKQYDMEKENPLIDRVYDNLLSVLSEEQIGKIMDLLTSEDYPVFLGAIDKVLHEHSINVLKLIDDGIELEQRNNNTDKVLH